jgi:hypothetical protein
MLLVFVRQSVALTEISIDLLVCNLLEMRFSKLFLSLTAYSLVAATLGQCSSNTKGKCPSTYNCTGTFSLSPPSSPQLSNIPSFLQFPQLITTTAAKTSTAIQPAACSHNTRTSTTQTFGVFATDPQYDGNNGAPYGTCKAYICSAPTASGMSGMRIVGRFFGGGFILLSSRLYEKVNGC